MQIRIQEVLGEAQEYAFLTKDWKDYTFEKQCPKDNLAVYIKNLKAFLTFDPVIPCYCYIPGLTRNTQKENAPPDVYHNIISTVKTGCNLNIWQQENF